MKQSPCHSPNQARRLPGFSNPLALLVAACLVVCSAQRAGAVPASPEPAELVQPDGSKVLLRLRGDEFFSWHETAQGYSVVRDAADGFWKFAQAATGRLALQPIAGARVGVSEPEGLQLKKHALPETRLLRAHLLQQQRSVRNQPLELPTAKAGASTQSSATAEESIGLTPPVSHISVSGTKTIRNIVVLACFADHWDSAGGTVLSSQGRVSITEYSNLFNQVNHTVDGAVGSVRDYYREVSYGKLTLESIIVPWVLLPQTEAYYGSDSADGTSLDLNGRQMVADAINAASAAGFDFSQGDSDADGWVDCLTILHSGHGQELGGNPSTSIWSKKGSMNSTITVNGVKTYRYHTEPALRGNTSNTSIIRIGTICHELGHFFGLPDLYDYSDASNGLGDWCLMASGSWNGSDGKRPAHFSAWTKCFLGFVSPRLLHSQVGLTLPRVEDNPVVGLLRDGMTNGEYYLVENRSKTGFDNDSTIYPGLLIYHVNSSSENNDLGTWPHPVVKIEEADGNNSLGSKAADSQAGDAWSSTSGLSGGFRDQTANATANAMLYQASPYTRYNNPTYYSFTTLNNFSAASSTMSCTVSTLRTMAPTQTVSTANYTVAWAPSSQASQYELQEGAKSIATSFSDGAESEDGLFDNWIVTGTLQRDSGGFHTGTNCYAMHQVYNGLWRSSVQSLTSRKPFKVTASTSFSFYLLSNLSTGNGSLKCQISNDGGNSWKTLGSYNGHITSWSQRSYSYANLSAQGILAGDTCMVRFLADFEYAGGWSAFPGYGFALDDIVLNNIEADSYTAWTSLAANLTSTSYPISGKTNGVYAYRVRAFANGLWQDFGPVSETTVSGLISNHTPEPGLLSLGAVANHPSTLSASTLVARAVDADSDTMSVPAVSASSTNGGTVSLSSGLLTYRPATNYVGADSFSYTLSDSRGASTNGTVTVTVISGALFNQLGLALLPASKAQIQFHGIPFNRYALDWSPSLVQPVSWQPLLTNQAASLGGLLFTNGLSSSNTFYRTRWLGGL